MIDILQEVTVWSDGTKNGIYHVNMQGHLVQHNDTVFKNPLKGFSKTGRKFIKIGERPDPQTRDDVIIVEGSNGNKYYIEDGKCSCPGFKFRGNCRHIEEK